MAIPKHARVTRVEQASAHTRLLDLALEEPLGFVGGQYMIVDSGLTLPSGKAVKRAYSLLGSDGDQMHVQLAVKRLPEGPGSGFMHQLEVGREVAFSGPWGKFYPAQATASGATLILATDTGITAALGLCQSTRLASLLGETLLVWLRIDDHDFLPERLVRARVPAACAQLRIESIPPIDHPRRIAHARGVLAAVLDERRLARAFIAGDGAVNYALLDDLIAGGVATTRDQLESFFNMPKKSAALQAGASAAASVTPTETP